MPFFNLARIALEAVGIGSPPENKAIPVVDKSLRAAIRNISIQKRCKPPEMADIDEILVHAEVQSTKIHGVTLETLREGWPKAPD
jgi:hypothetical protein